MLCALSLFFFLLFYYFFFFLFGSVTSDNSDDGANFKSFFFFLFFFFFFFSRFAKKEENISALRYFGSICSIVKYRVGFIFSLLLSFYSLLRIEIYKLYIPCTLYVVCEVAFVLVCDEILWSIIILLSSGMNSRDRKKRDDRQDERYTMISGSGAPFLTNFSYEIVYAFSTCIFVFFFFLCISRFFFLPFSFLFSLYLYTWRSSEYIFLSKSNPREIQPSFQPFNNYTIKLIVIVFQ